MRKIILPLIFMLMISFASAEVVLTKQPSEMYNMGDIINIPVKVTTLTNIDDFLTIDLICNGIDTQILKFPIILSSGEEKIIDFKTSIKKSFIGRSTGTCKLKAILGEETKLTNEFKISNKIEISLESEEKEFYPEEEISIEFEAIKSNGDLVEGYVNATIEGGNTTEALEINDVVNNGYGYITFSMPKKTKAEQYLVKINVFEKDPTGQITNYGFVNYNIKILQVPTELEIIIENKSIKPGTSAQIRTILHDQTGEKIESTSIIRITNSHEELIEETEIATDESLEIPTIYKEEPGTWEVYAYSNEIEGKETFEIIENAEVKTEIVNKTLTITNIGNIPYNDTIKIKINGTKLEINVSLDIEGKEKYVLTAPDGEYTVEISKNGESSVSEEVLLTGKTIGIKDAKSGLGKIIRHPISWLFIIVILGLMAFIIFKKGYNKKFIAYITRKKEKSRPRMNLKKASLLKTKNKATLSLSIKGKKQNIDLICLKIKNLKNLVSKKGQTEATLQKIVDIAEENKAYLYESNDAIFVLFVPTITKTFKNQEKAVLIAKKIKKILEEHNKMFKNQMDFGISMNYGSIIAKHDDKKLEFMSMGTLVTNSKKIASLSNKEILLSDKIKERLPANIKVEKHGGEDSNIYTIKEIKDREGNKKFINNFIKRLEGN